MQKAVFYIPQGSAKCYCPRAYLPALLPLMCRPSHIGQFRNECFLPQRAA